MKKQEDYNLLLSYEGELGVKVESVTLFDITEIIVTDGVYHFASGNNLVLSCPIERVIYVSGIKKE